eukprot:2645109-Prymnesium_polylepis.1
MLLGWSFVLRWGWFERAHPLAPHSQTHQGRGTFVHLALLECSSAVLVARQYGFTQEHIHKQLLDLVSIRDPTPVIPYIPSLAVARSALPPPPHVDGFLCLACQGP